MDEKEYNLNVYGYHIGLLESGLFQSLVVCTSEEERRRKYKNIQAQIRRNNTRKKRVMNLIEKVEYAS